MRPGQNMKRQRGRHNGQKPHMPVRTQTFDSSGPEVRIRGNAYQVLEKYLALARDATAAGDRVAAENFYQHAEHYYRLINSGHDGHHHQRPQHMHQNEQRMPEPNNPTIAPQPPATDPGSGPQPLAGPPIRPGTPEQQSN
ncbi:MAG: DUF4167 domain-containing protein [Proteobacteria bacterium]|nr:DUF4167 domain-containing protein [Pseudomonadota bacterium]